MITNPWFLQNEDPPPVVIIGSGPAGMSLAMALAEREVGSLVLEAGTDETSVYHQEPLAGRVLGDPYFPLDETRQRRFGGTSHVWDGWCRHLEDHDFAVREAIPHTGWPIGKWDLDPYATEAGLLLGVPPAREEWLTDRLVEVEFSKSAPVVFSKDYFAWVDDSPEAQFAFNCPAVQLEAREGRIEALHYFDPWENEPRTITPRIVVLAAGGIENTRLLQWSNATSPQRVVADDRALGRYFMEHPRSWGGVARVSGVEPMFGGAEGMLRLALSPAAMREFGTLAAYLSVPVSDEISNVTITTEQAPDPDNRIALSETDVDRYGMPRPEVTLRKTAPDYWTEKVAFELFGRYLVDNSLGIARANEFTLEGRINPDNPTPGTFDHMGGTRMSDDPATGVVDRDLKIHGCANGYVLGSSVFPTGGFAYSTFTTVQLALRLADHLSTQVQGG